MEAGVRSVEALLADPNATEAQVLGHEWAREVLAKIADQESPAQGYVFAGPEGVGKRTTALWFARLLMCTRREHGQGPCEACPTCLRLRAGQHPDLVEVDVGYGYDENDPKRPKLKIGIDQVRELFGSRRSGGYGEGAFGALEARYKIFLFPRAALLTEEASNCLLKSLEEPREGHLFILLAPTSTALLPTVLSRCSLLRFTPVPRDVIEDWLLDRSVEADRAAVSASLSDGRPGQALRLASEASLWTLRERVLEVATDLTRADAFTAVSASEKLVIDKGTPQEMMAGAERELDLLLYWFRDLLLVRNGVGDEGLLNQDRIDDLHASASHWSSAQLLDCVRSIEEARAMLRGNVLQKALFCRLMLRLRARG